jgi:hypothetical protein
MDHGMRSLAVPAEDVLSESGDEEAGMAPRSHFEKRAHTCFNLEGSPDRPSELFAKDVADGRCESPPGEGKGDPCGQDPASPGEAKLRSEGLSDLPEDHLGIWTSGHESDEVPKLSRTDPPVATSILLVPPDLEIDYPGETEPSGKCDAYILVVQNLARAIVLPERLEEDEGDPRLHSPGSAGRTGVRDREFSFC